MIDNRIKIINDICEKVNIEPLMNNMNNINSVNNINKKLNFEETIFKIYGDESNEKLRYVSNHSTGFIFEGRLIKKEKKEKKENNEVIKYRVKIILYPKIDLISDNIYDICDINKSENNEINIYQILSNFVLSKQTPHILLPMFTFLSNIQIFTLSNMIQMIGEENYEYVNFMKKYKENKYNDIIRVLITECGNRGNLFDFIKKNHNDPIFSLTHWKVILFQIISTIAVIQSKYPSFRHNNLKCNNIFIEKILNGTPYYYYTIGKKKYYVPSIKYYCQIGNFDFAYLEGNKQNRYFDLHYFLSNIIMSCSINQIVIPQEIKEFIDRVIPEKYQKLGNKFVNIKGKLLINDEYILPKDILEKDILFEDFREFKNDIIIDENQIIVL
jgi:hypothetical protein